MADMNITKTIYVNTEPVSALKPGKQDGNAAEINEVKQEKAPALENVVSTSEDGDTVQVKPEANERLNDGFVFSKKDENEAVKTDKDEKKDENEAVKSNDEEKKAWAEQAEKIASDTGEEKNERLKEMIEDAQEKSAEVKETLRAQAKEELQDDRKAENKAEDKAADDRNVQNAENLKTASEADLEEMYLSGKISSYQYNKEIEARKEEQTDAAENNKNVTDTTVKAQAEINENEDLQKNVVNGNLGAGYQTKEEQEVSRDALYGTRADERDNDKDFQINIVK